MNRGRERIRQAHLAEEKARREAELEALKAAEEEVNTHTHTALDHSIATLA